MPSLSHPVLRTWSDSCPAKLNLRLAVTGRREDGYHHLVSLVARVSLADELTLEWTADQEIDELKMSGDAALPEDGGNLVLRAVAAFRREVSFPGGITAHLKKRIPVGAGLGGGSSDAAGALRGLQAMWGNPLEAPALGKMAAALGADVPLFLAPSPVIMRGIGDELEPVPGWREALADWQVVIFRPGFGISTPWAYGEVAKSGAYSAAGTEENRYEAWKSKGLSVDGLLANDFRRVVDRRYPTIPVLLEALNGLEGVRAEMTGSGSACFALCTHHPVVEEVFGHVVRAWGESAFRREVRFF